MIFFCQTLLRDNSFVSAAWAPGTPPGATCRRPKPLPWGRRSAGRRVRRRPSPVPLRVARGLGHVRAAPVEFCLRPGPSPAATAAGAASRCGQREREREPSPHGPGCRHQRPPGGGRNRRRCCSGSRRLALPTNRSGEHAPPRPP